MVTYLLSITLRLSVPLFFLQLILARMGNTLAAKISRSM